MESVMRGRLEGNMNEGFSAYNIKKRRKMEKISENFAEFNSVVEASTLVESTNGVVESQDKKQDGEQKVEKNLKLGAKEKNKKKEDGVMTIKDISDTTLGISIENQKELLWREMYRKKLFNVDFEHLAKEVEEEKIALSENMDKREAVIYLCFIVLWIIFFCCSAEIRSTCLCNHTILTSLSSEVSLSESGNLELRNHIISSAGSTALPPVSGSSKTFQWKPNSNVWTKFSTLKTKKDAALWLVYVLTLKNFPRIGNFNEYKSACLRLTVRKIKYDDDPKSNLGFYNQDQEESFKTQNNYYRKWSSILGYSRDVLATQNAISPYGYFNEKYELSEDIVSPEVTFKYTHDGGFYGRGGYVQWLCDSNSDNAKAKMQKLLLETNYILDRRTTSVVVDALLVNKMLNTITYNAIFFIFDSTEKLEKYIEPQTEVTKYETKSFIINFVFFVSSFFCLILIILFQIFLIKKFSIKRYFTEVWKVLLFLQIVLTIVSCFLWLLNIALRKNLLEYAISLTETEDEFKQKSFDSLVWSNMKIVEIKYAFLFCGGLSCFLACVIFMKYLTFFGGFSTKAIDLTMQRLAIPVINLTIVTTLLFFCYVFVGQITLGLNSLYFSTFSESLRSSAAFIFGGLPDNINIYKVVRNRPLFSLMFFVLLFLFFIFIMSNFFMAIVFKTHQEMSDKIDKATKKSRSKHWALYETKFERLCVNIKKILTFFFYFCELKKRKILIEDDASGITNVKENEESEQEKSKSDEFLFPSYPSFFWKSLGLEDPLKKVEQADALEIKENNPELPNQYLLFSEFNMNEALEDNPDDVYSEYVTAINRKFCSPNVMDTEKTASVEKVYEHAREKQLADYQSAFKKLLSVFFLVIIVLMIYFQTAVYNLLNFDLAIQDAINMQEIHSSHLFIDVSHYGTTAYEKAEVWEPIKHFSEIISRNEVVNFIKSESFLNVLFQTSDKSQYDILFASALADMKDFKGQKYKPIIISNWNVLPLPNCVILRLKQRGSTLNLTELGFVCNESNLCTLYLPDSKEEMQKTLENLTNNNVLQDSTLFLEVLLIAYNGNTKQKLMTCKMHFLFSEGGLVFPTIQTSNIPVGAYEFTNYYTIISILLQALFLLLLVREIMYFILAFKRFAAAYKEHKNQEKSILFILGVYVFDDLFNLVDIFLIFFVILAALAWILFASSYANTVKFQADARTTYASASYNLNLYESINKSHSYLLFYLSSAASVIMLAFFRILKIFRDNKRVIILFITCYEVFPELLYAFMCTLAIYIGLTVVMHASFGHILTQYKTFFESLSSTFNIFIGQFSFGLLYRINAVVTSFFIFPILFLTSVLLFSLITSTLYRSFCLRVVEAKILEKILHTDRQMWTKKLSNFFKELCCKKISANQIYSLKPPDYEKSDSLYELEKKENAEIKKKNKPNKIFVLPKDVRTTQMSDEQYKILPSEIKRWANIEALDFIDRFRKYDLRYELAGKNKENLLKMLEEETYKEVLTLERKSKNVEEALRFKILLFEEKLKKEQEKLENYIKLLEDVAEEKEQNMDFLAASVEISKTKKEII